MDSLQVFRHKVRIAPRHLKTGMAQNLLQVEDTTSAPQIVDREGVAAMSLGT